MPRMRNRYTPAEIDTALLVLALTGHNSVDTARRLKSQGLDINPRTLRAWRTGTHAQRYAEIQRDHAPRIEAEMIGTAREIVLAANAATLEAIEATRDQVKDGEAKDPQRLRATSKPSLASQPTRPYSQKAGQPSYMAVTASTNYSRE